MFGKSFIHRKTRIIQLWLLNTVSVKIFLSLNLFISGNETRIHGPLGDGARRQDCLLRGKSKHREKVALNFCGGIVSILYFLPLKLFNNQIVSTSLDNSEPCSPGEKIPNDIVSRSYTFSQLLAHFLLFPSNFYNSSSVLGNFYSGLTRILLFLVFEVYVLFWAVCKK